MKNDYEKTIECLLGIETLKVHYNKFIKIYSTTEDSILKKLIEKLLSFLKRFVIVAKGNQRMIQIPLPRDQIIVVELMQYCEKCLNTKKPQWQIIAEKAGWKPTKPE